MCNNILHGFVVGKVYTLGRGEYGRLGHGDSNEEKRAPSVLNLPSCKQVAAGQAVSYALTQSGTVNQNLHPDKQWLWYGENVMCDVS